MNHLWPKLGEIPLVFEIWCWQGFRNAQAH